MEFFPLQNDAAWATNINNLLARMHFTVEMIQWTGLAPRAFGTDHNEEGCAEVACRAGPDHGFVTRTHGSYACPCPTFTCECES